MKNYFKHSITLLTILSFLLMIIGSSDDNAAIENEISDQTPSIEVSAKKLYADYDANGVSADMKYKGKVLSVTGKINNIDKDFMDEIYVSLKGDEYFGDIQCYFAESHIQEAANLSKGQTITVKGVCDGQMMNVLLKGCVID
jgi:hypothetical protein|tara:strand:- start:104 stop:529 length:426 start_codon:yes stop_codon:yes gene_type:complete